MNTQNKEFQRSYTLGERVSVRFAGGSIKMGRVVAEIASFQEDIKRFGCESSYPVYLVDLDAPEPGHRGSTVKRVRSSYRYLTTQRGGGCLHKLVSYVGITEAYSFCETCGEKQAY